MRPLKFIFAVVSLAALVGCATEPQQSAATPPVNPNVTMLGQGYRPVASAALAFDPPMALEQPLPDTSREGRSPSAFMGYEESVTTVSSVYQRDEIRAGPHNEFDRQAYTGRTSVTTR